MAAFLIINNVGMKINAGVNAKNWSIRLYVIKNLFGIQVNCECEYDKLYVVGEVSI